MNSTHIASNVPRRRARASGALLGASFAIAFAIAAPLGAQTPGQPASHSFGDIVVGADWLQANALPFDRDAMQSASFGLSLRRSRWAVEAGFLRIARTLSTVQGGYLSAGPVLRWKSVTFLPAVGVLGGEAYESRDSTGFDFIGAGGVTGHQARYSYSSAGTAGGSVGLGVEVPIYRALGFHAVVSQWYFSGAPLEDDRSRTVVGAGLSFRVWR